MSFFDGQPAGFTLIRNDGTEHNRIRGDLIPVDNIVIVEDGRYFVRTDGKDADGFIVYAEGWKTFTYRSSGS